MNGQAKELDLDDFLGHGGGGGGGGSFGGYLGNWRDDGTIDVWMHPAGLPAPIWAHRWYTVGTDRETKEPKLRPLRYNSVEDEIVHKSRFKRRRDGRLELPPQVCAFSRMVEWVWQAIASGDLDWTAPIFTLEAGEDSVTFHAGGFCGLIQAKSKNLNEKERSELKRAGIRLTEAWKESCCVRLQYAFRVIAHQRPDDGCLIALESQALGDKLKKAIQYRVADVGPVKGNPFVTPYAFRWKFDDTKQFADKYDAIPLTSLELPDAVREVMQRDPPTLDDVTAPGNPAELRMSFEQAWCHRNVLPPWDEIFGPAEKLAGTGGAPGDFAFGANAETTEPAAVEPAESEGEDPEDDLVLCDKCDKPMLASATKCPACGAEYDADGKLLPPPPAEDNFPASYNQKPKAPPRKRSAAAGRGRGR